MHFEIGKDHIGNECVVGLPTTPAIGFVFEANIRGVQEERFARQLRVNLPQADLFRALTQGLEAISEHLRLSETPVGSGRYHLGVFAVADVRVPGYGPIETCDVFEVQEVMPAVSVYSKRIPLTQEER